MNTPVNLTNAFLTPDFVVVAAVATMLAVLPATDALLAVEGGVTTTVVAEGEVVEVVAVAALARQWPLALIFRGTDDSEQLVLLEVPGCSTTPPIGNLKGAKINLEEWVNLGGGNQK